MSSLTKIKHPTAPHTMSSVTASTSDELGRAADLKRPSLTLSSAAAKKAKQLHDDTKTYHPNPRHFVMPLVHKMEKPLLAYSPTSPAYSATSPRFHVSPPDELPEGEEPYDPLSEGKETTAAATVEESK